MLPFRWGTRSWCVWPSLPGPNMRALALVAILLGSALDFQETQAQSASDTAAVARAIAAHLNDANGLPVVVLDEFICTSGWDDCRVRPGHARASRVPAETAVEAFADELDLPISSLADLEPVTCGWTVDGPKPHPLVAELGVPQFDGNEAVLDLNTSCARGGPAGGGFAQTHEFRLRRADDGSWDVTGRALRRITES